MTKSSIGLEKYKLNVYIKRLHIVIKYKTYIKLNKNSFFKQPTYIVEINF